jgi:hypothetical protein
MVAYCFAGYGRDSIAWEEMRMGDNTAKTVKVANWGPIGGVFFVAYIGAVVYFWHQASSFWGDIWAIIKAVAWPGILVYQAMRAFHV